MGSGKPKSVLWRPPGKLGNSLLWHFEQLRDFEAFSLEIGCFGVKKVKKLFKKLPPEISTQKVVVEVGEAGTLFLWHFEPF